MYIQVMTVEEIDQKFVDVKGESKQIFKCRFSDRRWTKDKTKTYVAFSIFGDFWETCPVQKGEMVLLQADLVNDYWKDSDGKQQAKTTLRDIKVLKNFGTDALPLHDRDQSGDPEVPF